MKLHKDQSGFGIVEIVIIIVMVGLTGAVGWLVYDRQKKTDQSSQTSSMINSFEECVAAGNPVRESSPAVCVANGKSFTEPIAPAVEPDITEKWTEYQTPDKNFTVRIPDGLTFVKSEMGDFLFTRQLTYKEGERGQVIPLEGGSDNPMGLFVNFQGNDPDIRGTEQDSFVTRQNDAVKKYVYIQHDDPDGIDIPKGATSYLYVIRKNNRVATVTYNTQSNQLEAFVEQMVRSITIL